MGLLWTIKWKTRRWKDKLEFKFNKIWWNYPRCSVCKHPLFDHVTYTEAHSRFGVCVNACCIEDGNLCDSWNVPITLQKEGLEK